MRCLITVPLLVLALAVCPTQAGIFQDIVNQIISIFERHEEAKYEISTTGNGYEERLYPTRKWVCAERRSDPETGRDLSKMFWPLYQYISGGNDRQEKIPMTVPVTTEFTVISASEKNYEMCFFIGEAHQANPPQPDPSTGVFIKNRPELRVLTRTVGGYINNEQEWMEEAGQLAAVLEENGITVTLSKMYWVGYDAPMKFWSRRNEVWFPVRN